MSDDGRRRQLFAIGFLGFAALGTPVAALGVAWAQMQRSFGVSLESLGLVMVALLLGRVLVSVYSGTLASRMGVGNYLLTGSLLMLTGYAGVAIAPGLLPLIVLHTTLGVGVTVLNTGINIHAAANYSGGRMNLLHTGFGLGSALGPLIVTLIVFHLGLDWRWSYIAFLVPQLGLTLLLARTRASWALNGQSGSGEPAQPLRRSLRLAPVWFGMLLFFLHGGIQHGTGALGNSLMIDGRGIAPDQAGLWVGIFWAGLTIGRLLTGVLVERIGNNRFMRASMLITIVGALLFRSNLGESPTFAGIALIGLSLSPVLPLLLADTPGRVGAAHSPNTVGLQIGSSGVGMAVVPALMAVLAERVGLETIGVGLVLIAFLSFLVHDGLLALERRHALRASLSPAR